MCKKSKLPIDVGSTYIWDARLTNISHQPSLWEKGGSGEATMIADENGSKKDAIFKTDENCKRVNGNHAQFIIRVGDIVFKAWVRTYYRNRSLDYAAQCNIFRVIDVFVDNAGNGKVKVELVNVLRHGKWAEEFDEGLQPLLSATWEKCDIEHCLTPVYCC